MDLEGRGEAGGGEGEGEGGEGRPAASRPKKPYLRRGQNMQKYAHKMRFPVLERAAAAAKQHSTGFQLPLRQLDSRPTSTSDYGTGRSAEFSPRSTSTSGDGRGGSGAGLRELSTIHSGVQKGERAATEVETHSHASSRLELLPETHQSSFSSNSVVLDAPGESSRLSEHVPANLTSETHSFALHEKRLSKQLESERLAGIALTNSEQRNLIVKSQAENIQKIKTAPSVASSQRSSDDTASPQPIGTSTPIDRQLIGSGGAGQRTEKVGEQSGQRINREGDQVEEREQSSSIRIPPIVQEYLDNHPPRFNFGSETTSHFELTPSERAISTGSGLSSRSRQSSGSRVQQLQQQSYGVQTSDLGLKTGIAQTTPSLSRHGEKERKDGRQWDTHQSPHRRVGRTHSDSHLSSHAHHSQQQQPSELPPARQPPPPFHMSHSFNTPFPAQPHLHSEYHRPSARRLSPQPHHSPPKSTPMSYFDAENLFSQTKKNLLMQLRDAIAHLDYAQSSLEEKGRQLLDVKQKLEAEYEEKLRKLEHDHEVWDEVKKKEMSKVEKERKGLEKLRKDIEAAGNDREKVLAQKLEETKNGQLRSETKNADLRTKITTLERQLKEKTEELRQRESEVARGHNVISLKDKRIGDLTRKLEQLQREFAEHVGGGMTERKLVSGQMVRGRRSAPAPLQERNGQNRSFPLSSEDGFYSMNDMRDTDSTSAQFHMVTATSASAARPKSVSWEDEENHKRLLRKVDERRTQLGVVATYRNQLGKVTRFVALNCGDFLFEYSNGDVRWIDANNIFEIYFTKVTRSIEVFIMRTEERAHKSIRLFYNGRIEIWRRHSETSVFDPAEGQRTEISTLPNGVKQVDVYNFTGFVRSMTKSSSTVQQYALNQALHYSGERVTIAKEAFDDVTWKDPEFMMRRNTVNGQPTVNLKLYGENIMHKFGWTESGFVLYHGKLNNESPAYSECICFSPVKPPTVSRAESGLGAGGTEQKTVDAGDRGGNTTIEAANGRRIIIR